MSGGGFTASVFLYLYPDKTREAMKKLAILCVLACALVACEKEKTMSINEEEPTGTPTDTIDPNTPTASLYVELCFMDRFPKNYGWLCIDSSIHNPIAKYGKIWLLDKETGSQIHNQQIGDVSTFFGSYRNSRNNMSYICYPHDSNYFYNHNDIFTLFDNGTFSSIRTLDQTFGTLDNVPFGDYYLLGAIGVPHEDTIKSYQGCIQRIRIDSTSVDNVGLHCIWRNSGCAWLTII